MERKTNSRLDGQNAIKAKRLKSLLWITEKPQYQVETIGQDLCVEMVEGNQCINYLTKLVEMLAFLESILIKRKE